MAIASAVLVLSADIPYIFLEGYEYYRFDILNELLEIAAIIALLVAYKKGEINIQKALLGGVKPTHVFVQAGVGSMAAAMAAFFTMVCCEDGDSFDMSQKQVITVVEPTSAGCMFKTAEADDGKLHFVTEGMNSMMAGLCCGEPCLAAWDILKECAENFVTIPDSVAADGMRILAGAEDYYEDPIIVSGESGASTFGLVADILRKPELTDIREALKLDANSVVLCFSTEGDTDKENYRSVLR